MAIEQVTLTSTLFLRSSTSNRTSVTDAWRARRFTALRCNASAAVLGILKRTVLNMLA